MSILDDIVHWMILVKTMYNVDKAQREQDQLRAEYTIKRDLILKNQTQRSTTEWQKKM